MFSLILVGLVVAYLVSRGRRFRGKAAVDRLLDTRHEDFDGLLSRYNPYYRSLPVSGRDRFLRRVLQFIESKKFEYIDIEREEIMPLLVSSAAVQLTYGLSRFQMDYFETIYIVKDKYRFGLYNMPFEGHVSDDGIYLSWHHFFREFTDYSDGQNVGLHEMAHALTYVNFTAREGRDAAFQKSFSHFLATA